jgi:hypothetical protein
MTERQVRRPTGDPIAYVFGHPEAKKVLYFLESATRGPYEDIRRVVGSDSQEFHRISRRLGQLDLIRMRAPRKAEFEGRRIRLILELSRKGSNLLPVFHRLDEVLVQNKGVVGKKSLDWLTAE